MVDKSTLGTRLKQTRLALELTLKALEARAGVSATHISEIERGKTSPTIGSLQKLARALGRDMTYFLESEPLDELGIQRAADRQAVPLGDTLGHSTPLAARIPGSALVVRQVELDLGGPPRRGGAGELDEVYLVEQGLVRFEIGDVQEELTAGDSIHLRAGLAFRYVNAGQDSARMFQFCGSRSSMPPSHRA